MTAPLARSIDDHTTLQSVRMGRIHLVRHGKSALSRRVWLSATEYRDWWAQYDSLGLDAKSTPTRAFWDAAAQADCVLCSTLPRSQETARLAAGDKTPHCDALFVEAPLPPPPWPNWLKLKPRFWGAIARIHWMWGGHGDQESAKHARQRAARAADRLLAEAANGRVVLLAAHGWFNRMIGQELTRRGWHCVADGGFRHWSVRTFEPSAELCLKSA